MELQIVEANPKNQKHPIIQIIKLCKWFYPIVTCVFPLKIENVQLNAEAAAVTGMMRQQHLSRQRNNSWSKNQEE